ncbi:MAG: tetratricopeptide repeat protein, partial [Candidatus Tectomicrobia bacterium]
IEASSDSHLWSQSYDRKLENIFAVQDEISAAIVGALREHLGLQVEAVPSATATRNTEAHDAYLRGRHLVVQRTRATIDGAVREFDKAIALDPDYALAHAELAMATILLAAYGDLLMSEAVTRAARHAEQAMTLDRDLAEAHTATGSVLWIRGDNDEALNYFENAIQINPNYSDTYIWMGILLNELGRYLEAFAARETNVRLNPLSIPATLNYARALIVRNRFAEAEQQLDNLASIHPFNFAGTRGQLASVGGKWANGVLGSLDVFRIDPDRSRPWNRLSWQFASIGLAKEALTITEHPPLSTLRWLGKHEDAVTTAQTLVTEDPIILENRRDLGLALAGAGDYGHARPILEEMWQRSSGRVTVTGLFQTAHAAALITIRRDADEEVDVAELVAAIRDNVRRYREAGITTPIHIYNVNYDEGLAAFLAGEREKGLTLIARGAEDGTFILQYEAYLQELYDDPDFAPIRAMQEVRQTRERQRFLDIVCTDNPYEAVWKPAEGTCERHAASSGT